jgi:hypothetical protein
MIGAIAKPNEQPTIRSEHYLVSTEERQSSAQAINANIRGSALQAHNVNKGFDRYILHFHPHHSGKSSSNKDTNVAPKSVAEAERSSSRIAEDAALSRLRPVPDGPCKW